MARRKKPAVQQQSGISQSGAPGSWARQSERSTAGGSGNTGEPQINPIMRKRKATASAGGAPLNFARRGRRSAQKPAVSFRQYAQAPLAAIPS